MTQPRTPRGTPTGGQFSEAAHGEADVTLDPPRPVDPQTAYRIEWRTFRYLTPGSDQDDDHEIRRQFAQHLQRFPAATWQAGWDAYIGPRQEILISPHKCRRCNGFGVDVRRGGMPCRECRGKGRTNLQALKANRAPAPG